MSKLKLDLNELRIESFETKDAEEARGTVQAHASAIMTCPSTCASCVTCYATCFASCPANTCGGNTCGRTCYSCVICPWSGGFTCEPAFCPR
jgi:hypothetical protein